MSVEDKHYFSKKKKKKKKKGSHRWGGTGPNGLPAGGLVTDGDFSFKSYSRRWLALLNIPYALLIYREKTSDIHDQIR